MISRMNSSKVIGLVALAEKPGLGEALRKAGFKRVQKRINKQNYSVYGYRIKPIPASYTNDDYG